MTGKIVKIVSNLYSVDIGSQVIDCHPRGKFRKEKIIPLVGDLCKIDVENCYILEILPRKNFLTRPMIANVDAALIVTSVKMPDLSLNLLDKMLLVVSMQNIIPILCFSKFDLLNESEKSQIDNICNYYKSIGYIVLKNTDISTLKKVLKDKTVVITGQTGAGKSTLLNHLDKSLHLKTDEISYALGRGKHTTRHVELFSFKDFYIADTPGFSSLDIKAFSKDEIRNSFKEFSNFECKYRDCMHDKEESCGVKKAVLENLIMASRYENYLNFIKKDKRNV